MLISGKFRKGILQKNDLCILDSNFAPERTIDFCIHYMYLLQPCVLPADSGTYSAVMYTAMAK